MLSVYESISEDYFLTKQKMGFFFYVYLFIFTLVHVITDEDGDEVSGQ
jgi:hypothetical protein